MPCPTPGEPEPTPALDGLLRAAEDAARELDRVGEQDERVRERLWERIGALRSSGGEQALEAAKSWTRRQEPFLRELGADTLGQLHPAAESLDFARRCRAAVLPLLSDVHEDVLQSALVALAHLYREEHPFDLAPVLPLVSHPSPDVRQACGFLLGGSPAERDAGALAALLVLMTDESEEVRDWATFGAGVQTEIRSPELTAALLERLGDSSETVRAEAISALAARGDERVVGAIHEALESGSVQSPVLDAIRALPRKEFLPELRGFLAADPEDAEIVAAVEACESGVPRPPDGGGHRSSAP